MSDDVFGDPGGMRALASRLRGRAHRLETIASDAHTRAQRTTFEGPAAVRFCSAVSESRRRLEGAAGMLKALASELDHTAAEVQRRIADARRREEESRRAADDARRRSAPRR